MDSAEVEHSTQRLLDCCPQGSTSLGANGSSLTGKRVKCLLRLLDIQNSDSNIKEIHLQRRSRRIQCSSRARILYIDKPIYHNHVADDLNIHFCWCMRERETTFSV